MRKVSILFVVLLAAFLVACSAVDSSEARTGDMILKVVSVTTGMNTEVYVQARANNRPVNFVAGDQFYIRETDGTMTALTKIPSPEWFNDGNAFYGIFTGSEELEIIFERFNGEVIPGTTFTPFFESLIVNSPLDGTTLTNNAGDSVHVSWLVGGNQDDSVTLGAQLNAASCVPQNEALESDAAILAALGPSAHLSNQSENTTVAALSATFAFDLILVDASDTFDCDAQLFINRVSSEFTTSNLTVAPAFKGVQGSSEAINRVIRNFSWVQ